MIPFHTSILILVVLALASADNNANTGPLVYHNWPPIAANSRAHVSPSQQHHHPQQLQSAHHHYRHHPHHAAPASTTSAHIMYQQQHLRAAASPSAAASQTHHMRYLSSPTSSGASGALHSAPSNLVYSQQKLRPLQSSMALLGIGQSQHHNRYVRPAAATSMIKHYAMPSAKPTSVQYPSYFNSGGSNAAGKRHPPVAMSVPAATKPAYGKSPANQQPQSGKNYAKKPSQPIVDYVFEKPLFGQHQLQLQHDVTPTTTLTTFVTGRPQQQPSPSAVKYSPIHTIQAPNLSLHGQKPFASLLSTPLLDNNHLFEKDSMFPTHMAFTADRPPSIPQYQVTESTINDQQAVRHSLAANNSPSLFNPDMNIMPLPATAHQQQQQPQYTLSDPQFSSPGNQPAASALVQHQLSFPSPSSSSSSAASAAASYATHLRYNQQMMQPFHHHPTAQQLSSAPMAAYNPTYLVQQSNQLFDHHKQHLFKPDRQYLHHHQPQQHQPHATHTHLISDLVESEFLPSFQLPSGDYAPVEQPAANHHHQMNASPPVDDPAVNVLTVQEVSNLLNFGTIHQEPAAATGQQQVGFVASNFYQQPNTAAINHGNNGGGAYDDTIYRHQQQNEDRINEATRQALSQQQQQQSELEQSSLMVTHHPNGAESTIFVTRSPEQRASEAEAESAHQRHQLRLAEQMSSDMRIYVPDEDYTGEQSDTFHKRSDHFESDRDVKDDPDAPVTVTESAEDVTQLKPVYEVVDETLDPVTISIDTSAVPTSETTTTESNTTIDNTNITIIVKDNLSMSTDDISVLHVTDQ